MTFKLCTVCQIFGTPIFSLKGVCTMLPFDWNYYLVVNEATSELEYFDGYKKGKLIPHKNSWIFESRYGEVDMHLWRNITGDNQAATGRMMWNYFAPACGINSPTEKHMALSICQFGKEFSCDSGHCIKWEKRCDYIKDCNDGTDEEYCNLVQIPKSYKKQLPPGEPRSHHVPACLESSQQGHAECGSLAIFTKIAIINFDKIDAQDMMVGMTVDITMKWNDLKLTYENLIDDATKEKKHGERKRISHDTMNR